MLCVALAAYTQSITGFAFGLVLLGLIGVMELVPLADAANASSILVIVNALVYLKHTTPRVHWPVLRLTLPSSFIGVFLGIAMLSWLRGNSLQLLRALLGMAIVVCAFLLLFQAQALKRRSSSGSFLLYGGVSGVMGGLFASSGPPMVYHLYRQPFEPEVIRQTLLLIFAANASLRLVTVLSIGELSMQALILGAEAIPVVFIVTWWQAKYPLKVSAHVIKRVVSTLLLIAGTALIWSAAKRLLFL
jgi:uncharacterized membrane protein YfcA